MSEQVQFTIIETPAGPVCIGGGIHAALAAIAGEVDAVGKTGYNQQQNFKYRPVDEFMNALNPIMSRHGVSVRPVKVEETMTERVETVNSQGKVGSKMCIGRRITFLFTHKDGSFAFAQTEGYGEDSGDKATNKAMAFAFKYLLMQAFVVPTVDMKDPDGEHPEPAAPRNASQSRPPQQQRAPQGSQKPPAPAPQPKAFTAEEVTAKRQEIVTFFLKGHTVDAFVAAMVKKGYVIGDAIKADIEKIHTEVQRTAEHSASKGEPK